MWRKINYVQTCHYDWTRNSYISEGKIRKLKNYISKKGSGVASNWGKLAQYAVWNGTQLQYVLNDSSLEIHKTPLKFE